MKSPFVKIPLISFRVAFVSDLFGIFVIQTNHHEISTCCFYFLFFNIMVMVVANPGLLNL